MKFEIYTHMITYIYSLIDPETQEVRYIGKSNTPSKRFIAYINTIHDDYSPHKINWIKQLESKGLKPVLSIIEETILDLWPEREKYWINFYRSMGNDLINLKDGDIGGGFFAESTKGLIGQRDSIKMRDQKVKEHLRDIFGRKIVRSDGRELGSIKVAAEELGVRQHTMRKYIESSEEVDGFKYYWVNSIPKHTRTVNNSKIRCIETGEEYDSILEASIMLKTNRQAIRESLNAGIKVKNRSFEYINKSKINQSSGIKSFRCVETGESLSMNEIVARTKVSSRNVYIHIQRGYAIKGFHYEKLK